MQVAFIIVLNVPRTAYIVATVVNILAYLNTSNVCLVINIDINDVTAADSLVLTTTLLNWRVLEIQTVLLQRFRTLIVKFTRLIECVVGNCLRHCFIVRNHLARVACGLELLSAFYVS